ncbi:MAG: sulfatase [Planctomycetota bacterium]
MTRPNILFAIADDASHMSAYGHRFLHTPHFDRVAAEGIRYDRAYTTNPKCAPSRASILTGQPTWSLREGCCHHGVFPEGVDVFPDFLEDAGYRVGFTGKGWGPGDYRAGGRVRNPAGNEFNARTLTPPDASRISARDYAANFADFLDAGDTSAPFCFWYGGHEPHRPYSPGEGRRATGEPEKIELPEYWPDDPVVRADVMDYAFEVEWFDTQLGRILAELERRGQLDDTLVIVTSDNGMPFPRVKGQMYEHDFRLPLAIRWPRQIAGGQVCRSLVSFTEFAPTILSAAGVDAPEPMVSAGLQDTFAGSPDPRRFVCMGRENHDLGREDDLGYPVRCIRNGEFLYVRNFAPDRWPAGNPETDFTGCDSSPTKSLILDHHQRGDDQHFALCFGRRPLEELYHAEADPACTNNLADDPALAHVKDDLWGTLRATLIDQRDPRIEGRGDVFDRYPYVGQDTHSWKAYTEGRWEPQRY